MVSTISPPASPDCNDCLPKVLLLLAHLICVDQQIHLKEDQALRAFIEASDVDDETRSQIAGIFGQDPAALEETPAQLAQRIPVTQRLEVFQQLLLMAHADGHFAPEEQLMVGQLACDWGLTSQQAEELIAKAAQMANDLTGEADAAGDLGQALRQVLRQQLSKGARSLLFNKKTQKVLESLPKKLAETAKQVEQDLLLSGPEYKAAINRCKQIAQEDFAYAEPILDEAQAALQQLDQDIARILTAFEAELEALSSKNAEAGTEPSQDAKSLREAVAQIQQTRQQLHDKILADIEQFQAARKAKRRSLDHFTIAFMGKTKAGKSTLHSVLTNGSWNDIGVGKQRTTRYNRVYELDSGLRIVDTPGIGAPGGKTDTETAKSIVDEADVICFVATNDSIQESEFEFLKLLRGQAKPVIVLLNIKQNLRDERRLRKFLQNPDKPFQKEGKDSIQGHINRIERYAQEHYPNGYVEVVPVMLLAAQLSQEEKYQGQSAGLYKASRVQNFLEQLKISVVEHGEMRRSQTLLGSIAIKLAEPQVGMRQEAQHYMESSQALADALSTLQPALISAHADTESSLKSGVNLVFCDLEREASRFSEDNWECDPSRLPSMWNSHITKLQVDQRLQNAYEQASQLFQEQITQYLDEISMDLSFNLKLNLEFSRFSTKGPDFGKEHVGWAGAAFGVAAAAAFFVFPPLSIPLGILSGLLGLISGFFKSKAARKQDISSEIRKAIRQSLEEQAKSINIQASQGLQQQKAIVSKQISRYFEQQIYGHKLLANCFKKTDQNIGNSIRKGNQAYALRILRWASSHKISLTSRNIEKFVRLVKRIPGKSIEIHTVDWLEIKRSLEEMSRVLQEKVIIIQE